MRCPLCNSSVSYADDNWLLVGCGTPDRPHVHAAHEGCVMLAALFALYREETAQWN